MFVFQSVEHVILGALWDYTGSFSGRVPVYVVAYNCHEEEKTTTSATRTSKQYKYR